MDIPANHKSNVLKHVTKVHIKKEPMPIKAGQEYWQRNNRNPYKLIPNLDKKTSFEENPRPTNIVTYYSQLMIDYTSSAIVQPLKIQYKLISHQLTDQQP